MKNILISGFLLSFELFTQGKLLNCPKLNIVVNIIDLNNKNWSYIKNYKVLLKGAELWKEEIFLNQYYYRHLY